MTEEEEQQLRGLGSDVSAAMHSRWEPGCVARAFGTRAPHAVVFTMQAWLDLDRLRSPLLDGLLPATVDELDASARVFGLSVLRLSGEEVILTANAMRNAIREAFSMSLDMKHPEAETGANVPDGFGNWMPVFTCLVTQCRVPHTEARAMDVGVALAIIATMRRNEGWQIAGTPYAMRDVLEPEGEP